MSKNKSFFQKLSDSFTSLFPFNSNARDLPNLSQNQFENNFSPIRLPLNRRLASEAFGKDDDNDIKIKRARLHHDPLSLPISRIMKLPNNQSEKCMAYNNNFNDAASDFSDTSNVSVSTSGVSSLHPRSNKRINFSHTEDVSLQPRTKYPRHLNVSQRKISPIAHKSLASANDFMSSPARKILEKLDKLTTPITGSDRISSLVLKERRSIKSAHGTLYNSYNRPAPPIQGKKPVPVKAVTVSATSNELTEASSCGPIRSKKPQRNKTFGFSDVDLDCDIDNRRCQLSTLNESVQVNFSNLPLLKMSQSTNTEESSISRLERSSSPTLEFTFRQPKNVDDEDYKSIKKPDVQVEFKSKISEEERKSYDRRYASGNSEMQKLWRCDTCFVENSTDSLECTNCENLSKLNKENVVVSEKVAVDTFNKSALVKKVLEKETNEEKNIVTGKVNESSNASITTQGFSTFTFNTTVSKSTIDKEFSCKSSEPNQSMFPTSSSSSKTSLFTETTSSSTGFTFGNNAPVSSQSTVTSVPLTNLFNAPLTSSETKPFIFSKPVTSEPISTPKEISNTSSSTAAPVGDNEKADIVTCKSSLGFGSVNVEPVSSTVGSSVLFGNSATSSVFSFKSTPNSSSQPSIGNALSVQSFNAPISSNTTSAVSSGSSKTMFGSTTNTTPFSFGASNIAIQSNITPVSIATPATNSSPFSFGSSMTVSSSSTVVPTTTTTIFGTTAVSATPFGNAAIPATPFGATAVPATPFGAAAIPATPFGATAAPATPFSATAAPATLFGSAAPASMFAFGMSKAEPVALNISSATTAIPFSSTATASPFSFGSSMVSPVSTAVTTDTSKNMFGVVNNPSPFSFAAANNNSVSNVTPVDNSKNIFGGTSNASSFAFGMSKTGPISSNTTSASTLEPASNVVPFGSIVTAAPFAFGTTNNTQAAPTGFSAVVSNPSSNTFGSSMNFGSVVPSANNAGFMFGQQSSTSVTPFGQSSSMGFNNQPQATAGSAITNFSFNSNSSAPAVPFGQSNTSHTFGSGTGTNLFSSNTTGPSAGFQFNTNADPSAGMFNFKGGDVSAMPTNNNIQSRKILRNRRKRP